MTPYHSMGNGSPERYNQTLIKVLLTLTEERKTECTSFKAPFVQAYKARRSDATGYTLHYLMLGRHPCLPMMFSLV